MQKWRSINSTVTQLISDDVLTVQEKGYGWRQAGQAICRLVFGRLAHLANIANTLSTLLERSALLTPLVTISLLEKVLSVVLKLGSLRYQQKAE